MGINRKARGIREAEGAIIKSENREKEDKRLSSKGGTDLFEKKKNCTRKPRLNEKSNNWTYSASRPGKIKGEAGDDHAGKQLLLRPLPKRVHVAAAASSTR